MQGMRAAVVVAALACAAAAPAAPAPCEMPVRLCLVVSPGAYKAADIKAVTTFYRSVLEGISPPAAGAGPRLLAAPGKAAILVAQPTGYLAADLQIPGQPGQTASDNIDYLVRAIEVSLTGDGPMLPMREEDMQLYCGGDAIGLGGVAGDAWIVPYSPFGTTTLAALGMPSVPDQIAVEPGMPLVPPGPFAVAHYGSALGAAGIAALGDAAATVIAQMVDADGDGVWDACAP